MKFFLLCVLLITSLYATKSNENFEKGMDYLLGRNSLKQDKVLAFEYLDKAAKEGDMAAEYNLALMYYMGDGVDQNITASLELLERSATKGYGRAIENIGRVYMQVIKFDKAIKWLKVNTENGDYQANYLLAEIYVQKEDFKNAKIYAKKAIESGYSEAQLLWEEYKLEKY